MDEVTIKKINKINRILKSIEIPVTFSFGCFDLRTYKPTLTLNRGARFEQSIACEVTENNQVKFYFKKYPSLKEAKTHKEYVENQNKIKIWDFGIESLNNVHITVPRYEK